MSNPISENIKKGTIGELLVQLRLLEHGVQSAPPIKDSGNDLIAIKGEIIRTIQVKTTTGEKFDKLSDLKDECCFSWNDIPGNDDMKLRKFLNWRFGIKSKDIIRITKTPNNETIEASTDNNAILLKLNAETNKVSIEICGCTTDEFIARTENEKINIYKPKIYDILALVKLEGECSNICLDNSKIFLLSKKEVTRSSYKVDKLTGKQLINRVSELFSQCST